MFLTGGGARSDILSLVILRPTAIIFLGIGAWRLSQADLTDYRSLFGIALALFALVFIHLIPLPPSLWSALPGREIIAEADRVAGLGSVWRPISLAPATTWNALFAMCVPMTVLVFAAQLDQKQLFKLLTIIIIVGLISGFLGLLQTIGSGERSFYLYRITNDDAAVGLFANRNHQAFLLACLFPALAAFASTAARTPEKNKVRAGLAIAAGLCLVPLLLVTGSRAGLILGVIGLLSVAFIYRTPKNNLPEKRKAHRFNIRRVLGPLLVVGLGLLTYLMSRAQAIDRLTASDPTEDLRYIIWQPMINLIIKYFPVGSGIGSFVESFQIDEPNSLLDTGYINHAHNDWLEALSTGGLAAAILMLIIMIGWVRIIWTARHQTSADNDHIILVRLGAAIVLLTAVASAVDYPLRVPSLACVFTLAAVWMTNRRHENVGHAKLATKTSGSD